jgi:hypothetical protein
MGGNYSWSGPSGATGLIRLTGSGATDAVMQYVDASLDNGDLATGDFGKITTGYHYRLH